MTLLKEIEEIKAASNAKLSKMKEEHDKALKVLHDQAKNDIEQAVAALSENVAVKQLKQLKADHHETLVELASLKVRNIKDDGKSEKR